MHVSLDCSLYTVDALAFVLGEISTPTSASKVKFLNSSSQLPPDFELLPADPDYVLDYSRLYQKRVLAADCCFPQQKHFARTSVEQVPVESVFRIDFETFLRESAKKSEEGNIFHTAKGIPIVSFKDLISNNLLSLAKKQSGESVLQLEDEDRQEQGGLGKRSPQGSPKPPKQTHPKRGRPPKPKPLKLKGDEEPAINQIRRPEELAGVIATNLGLSSPDDLKERAAHSFFPGDLLDLNQRQNPESSSRSSSDDGRDDPFSLFI